MKEYEFALIRYMQSAAAGELVNFGIVMWLRDERRLLYWVNRRSARLSKFLVDFDRAAHRKLVHHLEGKLRDVSDMVSDKQGKLFHGSPGELRLEGILALIYPRDSSCVQWSPAMGGVAADPEERLKQLVHELITRHDPSSSRPRRSESDISRAIDQELRLRGIESVLEPVVIRGKNFEYEFKGGWQNGSLQVLEPITFDLTHRDSVLDKANTWTGRLVNLGATEFRMTGVVAPPQLQDLMPAYRRAIRILRDSPHVRDVVEEKDFPKFLPTLEKELKSSQAAD